MASPDDNTNVPIGKVSNKQLRRDIILDLIERGTARGVIELSDLMAVLSDPVVAPHLNSHRINVRMFVHHLYMRGIEVLNQDLDKVRYKELPMVIALGNPIWETSFPNVAGQRFHFLNRYRDGVLSGRPFIYFRIGERGQMEYIGCGVIGEIAPDPDNAKVGPLRCPLKWFAEVRDYRPFANPVFWKDGANLLEDLVDDEWNDMVRDISEDTYNRILELERKPAASNRRSLFSGVDPDRMFDLLAFNKFMSENGIDEEDRESDPEKKLAMANIQEVAPEASDSSSLMMPARQRMGSVSQDSKITPGSAPRGIRRSRHSTAIGSRAEEIVIHVLVEEADAEGYQNIRWVALEGEKPGWDVEITDTNGLTYAVEVKGTSGKLFPSIELTAAEWQSAEELRERFWLFLVTECLGKNPKIQRIKDPVSLVQSGTLALSPVLWRLELSGNNET